MTAKQNQPEVLVVPANQLFAPGGPPACEPSHIVVIATTAQELSSLTKVNGTAYVRSDLVERADNQIERLEARIVELTTALGTAEAALQKVAAHA